MTSSPQSGPSSSVSNQLTNPNASLPANSAYASPAPIWLESGNEDDSMDMSSLLHSLRRQWLPGAITGAILGTVIGAVVFFFLPESHQAQALLRVSMSRDDIIGQDYRIDDREYNIYKQTQAALITSTFVLNTAIRDPNIESLNFFNKPDSQPLALLKQKLEVEYPGKSEILRIALSDKNDKEAVKIVNAVAEAYMKEVADTERITNAQRLEILRAQERKNSREIQDMTDDVQKLAAQVGTSDSDLARLNQQIERSQLSSIENERDRTKSQLDRLASELYVIQAARQARFVNPSQFDIEDQLEADREYYEAKRVASEYQRQLELYSQVTNRRTPEMDQIEAEIASQREVMARRRRELMPRIKHRIGRMYGVDDIAESSELVEMQAMAQVARSRLTEIDKRYEDQTQKLRNLTGFSAELVTKQSQLTNLQKSNDQIVAEIKRLELNMKRPPRVQLIQNAIIPERSSARTKLMLVIASWMATFICCVIGVAALDLTSKRLNSAKDIERRVGLPVVGALPALQGGLFGNARENDVVDSIDSVRAAITYNARGKKIQSVVITSALGGEGKSTVASQLAVSLARGGKRTLLIDGDVRNPQQHVVFGMPADRGLCDVLRGTLQLEEIVQATPAENLWILPAGRCDTAAFQALAGQGLGIAMERLTAQFDFVVVDSGPVLTGPEALIFGQFVDGAILSTRRDVSRINKVDEAKRRLEPVGIHIIGTVVNGTNTDSRRGLIVQQA